MCAFLGHVGRFCRVLNNRVFNCSSNSMAGSRGFLLVLLLATVTCIVIVQVSLDGGTFHNVLHSLDADKKSDMIVVISTSNEFANVSRSITLENTKSVLKYTQITFTKAPLTKKSSARKSASSTTKKLTSVPEKNHTTSQVLSAKLQIPKIQSGRKTNDSNIRKTPQMLIDRQARLQEILKHSDVLQRRARGDPMKALKIVPTVNPLNVTRLFILTYFRSGSSFFGELLQQNPKTFYQFEPLHYMTYDSRIPDSKTTEAFELFNSIYRCNFSNHDSYFNWAKKPKNQFLFGRSLYLWFSCRVNPKMCFVPDFVSAVCQRAHVQIMKVTRLHMRQLRTFLQENKDLGIKVIYLTRDPRGIVSSRWALDWCNGTSCSDPRVLCNEMEEDMSIFRDLQKHNPSKFVHVRYEDLVQNPGKVATDLFKFLHLPFSLVVQRFLRSHTKARKVDGLDPYSTRRNSSSMAYSWRQRITYEQLKNIQQSCFTAIKQLNFSLISSASELCSPSCTTVNDSSNNTLSKNKVEKHVLANFSELSSLLKPKKNYNNSFPQKSVNNKLLYKENKYSVPADKLPSVKRNAKDFINFPSLKNISVETSALNSSAKHSLKETSRIHSQHENYTKEPVLVNR